jgi:hypothetical protein
MGSMLPYIPYMDPMFNGFNVKKNVTEHASCQTTQRKRRSSKR